MTKLLQKNPKLLTQNDKVVK